MGTARRHECGDCWVFQTLLSCFALRVLTMTPTPEASIRFFGRPSPPPPPPLTITRSHTATANPSPALASPSSSPRIKHHTSKPNQHNLGVLTTRSKGDSTVGPSETGRFFFSSHFPYLFKVFTLLFFTGQTTEFYTMHRRHIFSAENRRKSGGIFSSWAGKARRQFLFLGSRRSEQRFAVKRHGREGQRLLFFFSPFLRIRSSELLFGILLWKQDQI